MDPIPFKEQNTVFLYEPGYELPAHVRDTHDGKIITSCFRLTVPEMEYMFQNGGIIWLEMIGERQPPIRLNVVKPEELTP